MKVTITENFLYKGRRYRKGEVAEIEDCSLLIARGFVEVCAPFFREEKAAEIVEEPAFEVAFTSTKRGRPKKK